MAEDVSELSGEELTKILTYAGYTLLAFELVKSMIVDPIKSFYERTESFNGPFKTYKEDVLSRHKIQFEACLLYLKDFMEAIDADDLLVIQNLRNHRNELAHELPDRLKMEEIKNNQHLLKRTKDVIFKLSNYRAYMEIGADPELAGIDWESVKGHEYLIFETIVNKVENLK